MEIFLLYETGDINYYKQIKNYNNVFILPLSLSGLISCKKNNFKYLDPIKYYNKKLHKKNILLSSKFEKNLIFTSKIKKFVKEEMTIYLRLRFNSVIFLKDLLSSINKKKKIKKIFISNKSYAQHETHTFFINEIFNYYLKKYNIEKVNIANLNSYKKKDYYLYDYIVESNINNKKKNILLNDLGYNLKRIIYLKKFKNVSIYFFINSKINIFKLLLLKILKIHPLNLKKQKNINKNRKIIASINKNFLGKNFYKLFLVFSEKFSFHFNDYEQQGKAIKKFLTKNNFKLIIINSFRGLSRLLIENKSREQIVLNVPHGTIAESYNQFDKIFKNNIANSVISKKSNFVVAQSKISENFFLKNKFKRNKILRGNLIFSEVRQEKKYFILYAVTTKQFFNMHFLGVDMYYEFYENLRFLNEISLKNNLKIVVKLHPSEAHNNHELSNMFANLIFSNDALDKLLKKSLVTLSFSSTVIEDSLISRIPVILFDRWNRYKHFKVTKKHGKTFPIFYLNNKNKLLQCIRKLSKVSYFKFEEIIFKNNFKKNIEKNIVNLI